MSGYCTICLFICSWSGNDGWRSAQNSGQKTPPRRAPRAVLARLLARACKRRSENSASSISSRHGNPSPTGETNFFTLRLERSAPKWRREPSTLQRSRSPCSPSFKINTASRRFLARPVESLGLRLGADLSIRPSGCRRASASAFCRARTHRRCRSFRCHPHDPARFIESQPRVLRSGEPARCAATVGRRPRSRR